MTWEIGSLRLPGEILIQYIVKQHFTIDTDNNSIINYQLSELN